MDVSKALLKQKHKWEAWVVNEKCWLFYFIMAAIFDTFHYWILKLLSSYTATPFCTEGVHRSTKAMTQVKKPGNHSKVKR